METETRAGGRPDWIAMESSEYQPTFPAWLLLVFSILVTVFVVGGVLMVINP